MASWKDFVFGGLSGMSATAVIQPIDTVKVRIQTIGESAKGASTNPITVARNLMAKEGVRGFYQGLDSALFRQATYGTSRLGIYKYLFNKRMKTKGEVVFHEKVGMSLFAGIMGSLVGNPSDLALVRFQSDATLPVEQRRNYRHVFDAFYRIVKEEGVLTLWRGIVPTILRAVSINVSMLTTYDEIKEFYNKRTEYKDSLSIRLKSSATAGIVLSIVSLPFDNAKTKLQKMVPNAQGVMPYKNIFDCMTKSVKREGFFGLWVGYPTFYMRVAPHAMLVLLIQDFLHLNFGTKKH